MVYLWLQDFDFLNYLLVDVSEGTTRVIVKESISGTDSSFKGREGKTSLTWNQNPESSPCVRVWGSPRHTMLYSSSCALTQCFLKWICSCPQSVGRLLFRWVTQIFMLNHRASYCWPEPFRCIPTLSPEGGERFRFGNIVFFMIQKKCGNNIIQRVVVYVNPSFRKPPTCLSFYTWFPYVFFVLHFKSLLYCYIGGRAYI